jgi:hypothetical protein
LIKVKSSGNSPELFYYLKMMEKRSSIQSGLGLIGIEEKETPPQNDGVFNGLGQVGILACLCTAGKN